MASGSGTTGKPNVPPENAIDEISGLLEVDELRAHDAKKPAAVVGSGATGAGFPPLSSPDGEGIDVSLETPGPVRVDSFFPPPPSAAQPSAVDDMTSEEDQGSTGNLAYEDLLEKLVLPSKPMAQAAAIPEHVSAPVAPAPLPVPTPAPQVQLHAPTPPPQLHVQSSPVTPTPVSLDLDALQAGTPGPLAASQEERTVVSVNPLLAEEQQAAARAPEPAHGPFPGVPVTPAPVHMHAAAQASMLTPAPTPMAARPASPAPFFPPQPKEQSRLLQLGGGKMIQMSYPVFGGMLLVSVLVGAMVAKLMAPSPVTVAVPVAPQPIPAAPAAAVPAAPPAAKVESLPSPTPAEPKAAENRPAVAEPAAEPEAIPEEAKPVHAAKPRAPKPAAASKPAAPKPAAAKVDKLLAEVPKAAKPAPAAKPAAPAKKPAKGGWTDPFAQ